MTSKQISNFKFRNGLEKYTSFSISNKFSFIDSLQFLSSLLDSLSKMIQIVQLSKDDIKYWSQKFGSNVLDLVKEKGFYLCEYMNGFEKFKE